MSGDCGHGWGYHFEGPGGPCFQCMKEENANLRDLVIERGDKLIGETNKVLLLRALLEQDRSIFHWLDAQGGLGYEKHSHIRERIAVIDTTLKGTK